MPKITIDDQDYEIDELSNEAKSSLEMLIATDQKIRELQRDMAIAQTARIAYARAAQQALPQKDGADKPLNDAVEKNQPEALQA